MSIDPLVEKDNSTVLRKSLDSFKTVIFFIHGTYLDAFNLLRYPKALRSAYGVSLYRNTAYLVAYSGATAALGLAFWVAVARLYSANDVGLGSALLSATALLSFVGTLGLGYGIIRYLPSSTNKAQFINSSFTLVALTSVIVSLVFVAGLSLWSPKLIFIRDNPIFLVSFVAFVATGALTTTVVQTFIGFRRSGYTLSFAILAGLPKFAIAVGFAYLFGVFAIFASWGIATIIALLVCLFVFLPRLLPGYLPIPTIRGRPNTEVSRFSFANYLSEVLWTLPTWILPIMVLNMLGAEENAYFFMAWTIANLVVALVNASSHSLFAEGSHMEGNLAFELKRTLKITTLLIVPAIVVVLLIGDKLLLLFGGEYSTEGARLFWFLAPVALPASLNFLYIGVARVEKRLRDIVLVAGGIALGTLILSYILIPHLGTIGAGIAWLASHVMMSFITVPNILRRLR